MATMSSLQCAPQNCMIYSGVLLANLPSPQQKRYGRTCLSGSVRCVGQRHNTQPVSDGLYQGPLVVQIVHSVNSKVDSQRSMSFERVSRT
eukprot:scaffold185064_cov52-Prasinocladus_malaysianus.AAC.1